MPVGLMHNSILDPKSISCPICSSTTYKPIVYLDQGRVMQTCLACGLVFVTPSWTGAIAKDAFSDYQGWPEGISGGVSDRSNGLIQISQQIKKYVQVSNSNTPKLLDIGCADGEFFRLMETQGLLFESYGVEPDPKWNQHDYGNATVYHQLLHDCQFPNARFDVVTILDAFCYFPDPIVHIQEIMRILKPNGLFVFDIPGQLYLHLRGLIGRVLGMTRTHTFAAYPFYYSHKSIRVLLRDLSHKIEVVIIDRGTAQEHTLLEFAMLPYIQMIKQSSRLFTSLREASPKLIYVVRKL